MQGEVPRTAHQLTTVCVSCLAPGGTPGPSMQDRKLWEWAFPPSDVAPSGSEEPPELQECVGKLQERLSRKGALLEQERVGRKSGLPDKRRAARGAGVRRQAAGTLEQEKWVAWLGASGQEGWVAWLGAPGQAG